MSTTPASTPALTAFEQEVMDNNPEFDLDEPTIVESLEEAAFILEENPTAAVLIRPKSVRL
jgi:hypothetical protein